MQTQTHALPTAHVVSAADARNSNNNVNIINGNVNDNFDNDELLKKDDNSSCSNNDAADDINAGSLVKITLELVSNSSSSTTNNNNDNNDNNTVVERRDVLVDPVW